MFYPKQLPKWEKRPLEVRYFFNPLVILNIFLNLVRIYKKEHGQALPFLIPFCILPFFIYKDFYESLPRTKKTLFTTWLQEKNIKHFYPERYQALYPYIQEALLLGFSQKLLYMNDNLIDSANADKDSALNTKLTICSIWFSPKIYRENLQSMGVGYEFSN